MAGVQPARQLVAGRAAVRAPPYAPQPIVTRERCVSRLATAGAADPNPVKGARNCRFLLLLDFSFFSLNLGLLFLSLTRIFFP